MINIERILAKIFLCGRGYRYELPTGKALNMNAQVLIQKPISSRIFPLFITALLLVCIVIIPYPATLSAALQASTPLPLTSAEQTWLKQHPVIRLAPDPDFKPIEFFDRHGNYQGVAADNIRVLEDKLGVKFSIVKTKNWDEVLVKFRNNEIDLLGAIVATPKRREFMRISEPLFHVPGAIIVRNTVERELTIDDFKAKGMRVAVVSNYTAHDIIKSSYPDINLDVVPDTATGLTKVSFGMVDAYIENLATATHYMQEMGISNIHTAGVTPFRYDWGIGIRKDWPELEGILNKGIASITQEERQMALNRWLPVLQTAKGWRPGKLFIGSTVSAVIALLFMATLAWNRTLARRVAEQTARLRNEVEERKLAENVVRSLNAGLEERVNERTAELEKEIAQRVTAQAELEQLNRSLEERINMTVSDLRNKDQFLIQQGRLAAMGEMINNIAHQWRQPLNNIGLIIQNLQFSYDDGTITDEEMKEEIGKAMDVIMHMSRTIDDFRNFFREDKQKCSFSISKTVHRALEFVSSALASHNIQVLLEDDENVSVIGYQNEYAQVLLNILSNSRETCIERSVASPSIFIRVSTENKHSVVYIRDNCGGIADDVMLRIFDPYFTTRAPDKGTGIGLYMSKVIIEQNMNGHLTANNVQGGVEFRIEV